MRLGATALLLIAATTLTGCVDLPVVGNLGEQVKPYLPGFIREKLFGPEQQAAETRAMSQTAAQRRRRRMERAAGQHASAGPEAPDDAHEAAVPARRENLSALYEQYLSRNMEFDHLRTRAMEQLINGQTDKAIESLKQALAKKPGDKSAEELLHLAQNPPMSRPMDAAPVAVPGLPDRAPLELSGGSSD